MSAGMSAGDLFVGSQEDLDRQVAARLQAEFDAEVHIRMQQAVCVYVYVFVYEKEAVGSMCMCICICIGSSSEAAGRVQLHSTCSLRCSYTPPAGGV